MVTKTYKNITLLGSSHIARQSVKEVEQLIEELKPQIIALELDHGRLQGLLQERKEAAKPSIRAFGFKGYLFAKFGSYVEHKLGKIVGVKPGAEMKRAYELAQQKQLRVALIDKLITHTMKRLTSSISWTEKWNFLVDVVKGTGDYFSGRFFGKKQELPFDLRTVPSEDLIAALISKVKDRYPNVYRVMVAERNEYMAHKLLILQRQFPEDKILAIVGAGHVADMYELLEKYDVGHN